MHPTVNITTVYILRVQPHNPPCEDVHQERADARITTEECTCALQVNQPTVPTERLMAVNMSAGAGLLFCLHVIL